ncbi:MAG: ABC transporter permease [Hyphomicrobiales bacterium]
MTDAAAPVTERGSPSAFSARMENWRRGAYRFRQSRLSLVGLAIAAFLIFIAIFGPWLAPHSDQVAGAIDTASRFRPPSRLFPFGTNDVGQDMLSLVLAGARISVLAGLAVVAIGALVGILVGAAAGYAGGLADEILMRLTDLMLTLPSLILAMAIAAALGPGIGNMIAAIAVSWWPGFARLVRGEVIAKKQEAFIDAAHAAGAGSARIVLRHILPNIVSPIIVKMSLDVGFAILTVASLGFVGIGVAPPTPEWGSLLSVARGYMPDYWWTAIFPGFAIFLAVFGFNLLGDGLRDVLDPKARR